MSETNPEYVDYVDKNNLIYCNVTDIHSRSASTQAFSSTVLAQIRDAMFLPRSSQDTNNTFNFGSLRTSSCSKWVRDTTMLIFSSGFGDTTAFQAADMGVSRI
jgi:hypothetical protein